MANKYTLYNKDDELRKKIGDIKIAKNNRTELFYTLAGHEEFENIMKLVISYGDQRELEAFKTIKTEGEEFYSGDDWFMDDNIRSNTFIGVKEAWLEDKIESLTTKKEKE